MYFNKIIKGGKYQGGKLFRNYKEYEYWCDLIEQIHNRAEFDPETERGEPNPNLGNPCKVCNLFRHKCPNIQIESKSEILEPDISCSHQYKTLKKQQYYQKLGKQAKAKQCQNKGGKFSLVSGPFSFCLDLGSWIKSDKAHGTVLTYLPRYPTSRVKFSKGICPICNTTV